MTTHSSITAGTSQCDKIEAALRSRIGEWVPMPDLYFASGSMAVHSRISDLRSRGLQIDHRNLRRGSMVISQYRLIDRAPQPELF